MKKVTIPDQKYNVTLGYKMFQNCTSLSDITIGSRVVGIGDSAFENCSALKTVGLPTGLTNIGKWAFKDCTSLTSIDLPEGLKTIDPGAFKNCISMESVTFPETLESINSQYSPYINRTEYSGAFEGCELLRKILFTTTPPSTHQAVHCLCKAERRFTPHQMPLLVL